jgi:hypothetical protein
VNARKSCSPTRSADTLARHKINHDLVGAGVQRDDALRHAVGPRERRPHGQPRKHRKCDTAALRHSILPA